MIFRPAKKRTEKIAYKNRTSPVGGEGRPTRQSSVRGGVDADAGAIFMRRGSGNKQRCLFKGESMRWRSYSCRWSGSRFKGEQTRKSGLAKNLLSAGGFSPVRLPTVAIQQVSDTGWHASWIAHWHSLAVSCWPRPLKPSKHRRQTAAIATSDENEGETTRGRSAAQAAVGWLLRRRWRRQQ